MSTVSALPHKRDKLVEDARCVLEEAQAEGYETVVVLGFKDGLITTHSSANTSRLQVIGALEVAKQAIWHA